MYPISSFGHSVALFSSYHPKLTKNPRVELHLSFTINVYIQKMFRPEQDAINCTILNSANAAERKVGLFLKRIKFLTC